MMRKDASLHVRQHLTTKVNCDVILLDRVVCPSLSEEVHYEGSSTVWGVAIHQLMPRLMVGRRELESGSRE